jgi:hypothetical protein
MTIFLNTPFLLDTLLLRFDTLPEQLLQPLLHRLRYSQMSYSPSDEFCDCDQLFHQERD